jgi:hypothetical protein
MPRKDRVRLTSGSFRIGSRTAAQRFRRVATISETISFFWRWRQLAPPYCDIIRSFWVLSS